MPWISRPALRRWAPSAVVIEGAGTRSSSPAIVRIVLRAAVSRIDASAAHPACLQRTRMFPEPKIMPLDSNSRFIGGLCGVAVLLLVAWLHGKGPDIERGVPRCEPQDPIRDCAKCREGAATARMNGETSPLPMQVFVVAPRSWRSRQHPAASGSGRVACGIGGADAVAVSASVWCLPVCDASVRGWTASSSSIGRQAGEWEEATWRRERCDAGAVPVVGAA